MKSLTPCFVFCQVMNVNLSAGDKVVLEDMGYGENTMLANESILMRGLVVRSHSNQISIRLHSPRALAASVLLRYQCKSKSQNRTHLHRTYWCKKVGMEWKFRLETLILLIVIARSSDKQRKHRLQVFKIQRTLSSFQITFC